MPVFTTLFPGHAAVQKLSRSELERAISLSISAEYEAIRFYMDSAESTDPFVKAGPDEITAEESVDTL